MPPSTICNFNDHVKEPTTVRRVGAAASGIASMVFVETAFLVCSTLVETCDVSAPSPSPPCFLDALSDNVTHSHVSSDTITLWHSAVASEKSRRASTLSPSWYGPFGSPTVSKIADSLA